MQKLIYYKMRLLTFKSLYRKPMSRYICGNEIGRFKEKVKKNV